MTQTLLSGDVPQIRTRPPLLWSGWLVDAVSAVYLCSALYLWITGLGKIDVSAMSDFGLASVLPVSHWVALALLAIGFAVSLSSRLAYLPMTWLHLLALIAILHLTPAIIYETTRYSWTWKHIGIIDFIMRHGRVEPSIRYLPAYHNWPGFFFVGAWVSEYLHATPLDLARAVRFVPAISNTLYCLALIPLYRALNRDIRQLLLACWIFVTGNWIGQDYFSPQGTVYLFYLLLLGLCLSVLCLPSYWGRFLPLKWQPANFVINLIVSEKQPSAPQAGRGLRVAATVAALALIAVTTATHQLTPIAIIFSLGALTVIGRLNPFFFLFAVLIELTWLLYMATPFVTGHLAEELDVFGQGLIQASERLVDTAIVTRGMYWVVLVGRITTGLIGLLALCGGLRRILNGHVDVRAAVLMLAPFPLFVNSYGGEVMFRIYFLALPFFAFFAASLFFPTPDKGNSMLGRAAIAVVAAALSVGFIFGNNGKDRQYTFTQDEIEASQWVYEHGQPGSLLIEGARAYPSQFLNYENFTYIPIANETKAERQRIINDPVDTFARWLSSSSVTDGYIIFTRSQKVYSDAEGIMPIGSLDEIERKLLASPRFVLVHSTPNTKVFKLHPTVGTMGGPAT